MKHLSEEEYTDKLIKILQSRCNESDIKIENLDEMYNRYLQLENKNKSAAEQTTVNLTLKKDPYIKLKGGKVGFSSEFWLILYDLNIYLLKQIIPYTIIAKGESKIAVDNAIVLPIIIRNMGLESADYYLTTYYEYDDGYEDSFILTPSFLNENEEMINLSSICGDKQELEITKLENIIRTYFKLRRFDELKIDLLIKEFIQEAFVSKFLKNGDENNGNMSIIYDDKKNLRMSPLYDFDFCCGNERRSNIEKTVNGSTDIEEFIRHYRIYPWFCDWIKKSILSLDIEQIFKDHNDMRYTVNNDYYKEFFKAQIVRVRNAFYQAQEIKKEEM